MDVRFNPESSVPEPFFVRAKKVFSLFSSDLRIKRVSKKIGKPPKMDSNLTFQMGFFIHVLFSTCNSGHHAPTICQPTRTPVKGSFFPTGPIDITIEATSTKKPRGQESLASYFGDEILVTKKGIRLRKNPSKFASTRWISLFERHDFGTFQAF